MPCSSFPQALDLLLAAFAGFDPLLALRATCRAAPARYAPVLRPRLWAATMPLQKRGVACLEAACQDGNLARAQWVAAAFAGVGVRESVALRTACACGHLAVAAWLADRFGLTVADARAADNWALRRACARGHLRVAAWLADRFGLTVADARAFNNWALRYSCRNDHLSVAARVTGRFGLESADARACDDHVSYWTYKNGLTPIIIWFADRFNTNMDAKARNVLFRTACLTGRLALAAWLADRFSLSLAAAEALREACANGHLSVAIWLADRFGLTANVYITTMCWARSLGPDLIVTWLERRATGT